MMVVAGGGGMIPAAPSGSDVVVEVDCVFVFVNEGGPLAVKLNEGVPVNESEVVDEGEVEVGVLVDCWGEIGGGGVEDVGGGALTRFQTWWIPPLQLNICI
jgi:hypothetical protein